MLALLKPQVLDSEHTQQFDRWKDKDVQLQKQKQIKNPPKASEKKRETKDLQILQGRHKKCNKD